MDRLVWQRERLERSERATSWLDIGPDSEENRGHNMHPSGGSYMRGNSLCYLSSSSSSSSSSQMPVNDHNSFSLVHNSTDSNSNNLANEWPPNSPADSDFGSSLSALAASNSAQPPFLHSPLLRSTSDNLNHPVDPSLSTTFNQSHSFSRPPKGAQLPDPSQYPDTYGLRSRLASSVPALTTDSASSSTRSSAAYTNSTIGLPLANEHNLIHVVSSGEEEPHGITPHDETVDSQHLFAAKESNSLPPPSVPPPPPPPLDVTRQSPTRRPSTTRSRSSSMGQNATTSLHSESVRNSACLDMTWESVDERDELGISEDDTDDDHLLTADEDEDEEEERTAAIVIAEMGTGLIVHGDGVAVQSLQVQPGMFSTVFPPACLIRLSIRHYSSSHWIV